MTIIYYAVRVNDISDKNISILIDSSFDLILPCIIANPDDLIPAVYGFNNFENFVVSSLKFKGDEAIRKNVSNTFKLICNNHYVNSKYSKEQFRPSPVKKMQEDKDQPMPAEGEPLQKDEADVAPYEEPKVYFLKVLLKNLPTTNSKNEK